MVEQDKWRLFEDFHLFFIKVNLFKMGRPEKFEQNFPEVFVLTK